MTRATQVAIRTANGNRASVRIGPSVCFAAWLALGLVSLTGCGLFNMQRQSELATNGVLLENPLFVPQTDSEFVWNQIIDELDDDFKIRREVPVRIVENVITEGWIETFPTSSATLLEPWRNDSTPGFERLHATLQSVRRWCRVRVIPDTGGFRIEVAVYKELEDLDQPEFANIGGATYRYDTAVDENRNGDELRIGPDSHGWISMGRDTSLEQRILGNLLGRLTGPM